MPVMFQQVRHHLRLGRVERRMRQQRHPLGRNQVPGRRVDRRLGRQRAAGLPHHVERVAGRHRARPGQHRRRAGRVGAGETDGYAYLICDETERPDWHQRLVEGYTVSSQILATLPDHLLAEAVQGRICTRREAEAWWEQTLAFHQGDRSPDVIIDAVAFLVAGGYLTTHAHPSGDADLTRPTWVPSPPG